MVTGSCMCGTVRFRVDADFSTAGYCHCTRCQHRTGVPLGALSGMVAADAVEILEGADSIRTWRPDEGFPKSFCASCGGHVWAGEPGSGGVVAIRLGALDGDPGIRPRWHQWVDASPDWEPLPDDGLPRYPGPREQD
ncbi:GFA family protein [Candidatus Solirubrobacter pratensis]|uniref:GFA family protein n=1 Tax=Candidatus Solirubrobacter pratensis TaxID=1298857 RepID=UPI000408C3DF|nr:GFA family protein [Candidatus Solirubrobacter pratensis]